jgi:hypothetical protein
MPIIYALLFALGMVIAPEPTTLHEILGIQECKESIIQYLQTSPALAHVNTQYKEILQSLVPKLIVSYKMTPTAMILNIRGHNIEYQILLPSCQFPLKEDVIYNVNCLTHFYYNLKLDEDEDPSEHDPQFILRPYQPRHNIETQFSDGSIGMLLDNIYKLASGFYYCFEVKEGTDLKKLIELFLPVAKTLHHKDMLLPSIEDLFAEHLNYLRKNFYSYRLMFRNPEKIQAVVLENIIRKLAKYVARLRFDYTKVRKHLESTCTFNPIVKVFAGGLICDEARACYEHDPEIEPDDKPGEVADTSWTEAYFDEFPTLDNYSDPEELRMVQTYWKLLYKCIRDEYQILLTRYKTYIERKWSNVPRQSRLKRRLQIHQSRLIRALNLEEPSYSKWRNMNSRMIESLHLEPTKTKSHFIFI